jgi:hypothetical protein
VALVFNMLLPASVVTTEAAASKTAPHYWLQRTYWNWRNPIGHRRGRGVFLLRPIALCPIYIRLLVSLTFRTTHALANA